MILHVVAVYDSATQAFGRPIFVNTRGQAVRSFTDEVRDLSRGPAENPLAHHPEDFELRLLGLFDDSNGRFVQENIELLIRGKDAVGEKQ